MEPRPQRPRSTPGQGHQTNPSQGGRPASPQPGYPGAPPDAFADEYEEQTYIAPPRTEYDYSPLDLAPPGQRRRRQFVAAAIGALAVLMVAAIAVLAYLLLGGDNEDPSVDVAALETQNAQSASTVNSQSTLIAEAGAAQTATAGGEVAVTEEAATGTDSTSGAEGDEPTTSAETGESTAADDSPDTTEVAGEATTEPSGAGAGEAGPNVAALDALQPGADALPPALDADDDSSLDLASVVSALGSSRTAEQNLEKWGWSGNSGRIWMASDPEALEVGATSSLTVSIHGFKDTVSAEEALTYFSDVLASNPEYEEGEAPQLGQVSRILSTTDENGGVVVAVYVQQDNILYRFGGFSPAGGDPTDDVLALANATLPTGE